MKQTVFTKIDTEHELISHLSNSEIVYNILTSNVINKKIELEAKRLQLEKSEKEIDEKYKVR